MSEKRVQIIQSRDEDGRKDGRRKRKDGLEREEKKTRKRLEWH